MGMPSLAPAKEDASQACGSFHIVIVKKSHSTDAATRKTAGRSHPCERNLAAQQRSHRRLVRV